MSLYVAPHPTTPLSDVAERDYQCLLCSLGYETRSRALAERLGGGVPIYAAGFTHSHTEAYGPNQELLESLGAKVFETDDDDFAIWAGTWLAETDHRRVAIDISSMSRPRIAAIVDAVRSSENADLIVDFLYVPQLYEGPPEPDDVPSSLAPVSPAFAGWETELEHPVVILFGLGYEPYRAAAAIDALEPALAIPFFPIGSNPAFVDDVEAANADVLRLDRQGIVEARKYRIEEPFNCFAELDALISMYIERGESRPLLLPLGPKIFALVCLLAAAVREPTVPVWRVSPGLLDRPEDHHAEDTLVTLRVSAGPIEAELDPAP